MILNGGYILGFNRISLKPKHNIALEMNLFQTKRECWFYLEWGYADGSSLILCNLENWCILKEKLKPLSAKPTKRSNTLKQFVGNSRRIVWVFDHFVGLVLKGLTTDNYWIIIGMIDNYQMLTWILRYQGIF